MLEKTVGDLGLDSVQVTVYKYTMKSEQRNVKSDKLDTDRNGIIKRVGIENLQAERCTWKVCTLKSP